METTQHNVLISILFAILICLIAVLGFFTWNLSAQVRNLQTTQDQQSSTPPATASIQTQSARPQAVPLPGSPNQQNGQLQGQQNGGSTPVNPNPANPFSGLNDPFGDPFDDSWPGFMNPGDSFAEMQQRMDELMDSMTRGFPFFNQEDFGFGFMNEGPVVSMTEDSDAYLIVIEVPDGQEVEVNTEVEGNMLMVSGSVRNERDESSSGINSRSMQESRFSQSVYLPEAVDEDAITIDRNTDEIVVTVPKAGNTM